MLEYLEGAVGGLGVVILCSLIPRLFVADPTLRKKQLYLDFILIPLFVGALALSFRQLSAAGVAALLGGAVLLWRHQRHRPDMVVRGSLMDEAITPQLAAKLRVLEGTALSQVPADELPPSPSLAVASPEDGDEALRRRRRRRAHS
jgi:hypothetical protein